MICVFFGFLVFVLAASYALAWAMDAMHPCGYRGMNDE